MYCCNLHHLTKHSYQKSPLKPFCLNNVIEIIYPRYRTKAIQIYSITLTMWRFKSLQVKSNCIISVHTINFMDSITNQLIHCLSVHWVRTQMLAPPYMYTYVQYPKQFYKKEIESWNLLFSDATISIFF